MMKGEKEMREKFVFVFLIYKNLFGEVSRTSLFSMFQ